MAQTATVAYMKDGVLEVDKFAGDMVSVEGRDGELVVKVAIGETLSDEDDDDASPFGHLQRHKPREKQQTRVPLVRAVHVYAKGSWVHVVVLDDREALPPEEE